MNSVCFWSRTYAIHDLTKCGLKPKEEDFQRLIFSPFCPCCSQPSTERCHTAASSLCYSGRCMMMRYSSHSLFMIASCALI